MKMFNRGKLVLFLMISLGLGAAVFAFWFRYEQRRRTIELWGSGNVLLVRDASAVELLRLRPASGPAAESLAETVIFGGRSLAVVERADISRAGGLVHLRHALIQDASYDWDRSAAGQAAPSWQYALRFSRDPEEALFGFDLDGQLATLAGRDRVVALSPHLARGLRAFFDEALAAGESSDAP